MTQEIEEGEKQNQITPQETREITPGWKQGIQILIAQSKLQAYTQAKNSNANLQEDTLALQIDITQVNIEERAKRMKRNEEEESYL